MCMSLHAQTHGVVGGGTGVSRESPHCQKASSWKKEASSTSLLSRAPGRIMVLASSEFGPRDRKGMNSWKNGSFQCEYLQLVGDECGMVCIFRT